MVRSKSSPLRSLREVNYSDPSVIFWFFGQNKQPEHVTVPPKEPPIVSLPPKKTVKNKSSVEHVELLVKNDSLVHPLLETSAELPALTDLQVFITEAILSEESWTCPFERIYEYVSKRWRYIRRRDGSNYTTDCRRAIQANLRHNPNHVALFRRDKNKQGNWTVCRTMEDAIEASKERQAEKRASRREKEDRMLGSDGGKENEDDKEDSMSEDEEAAPVAPMEVQRFAEKSTPAAPAAQEKSNGNEAAEEMESDKEEDVKEEEIEEEGEGDEMANDPEEEVPEEGAEESAEDSGEDEEEEIQDDKKPEKHEMKEAKLTPLQTMICECINDNGGSCHFDLIVHHVSKGWSKIKNGNSDAKSAILAALTDSKKIFKRDTKRTGWWIINKEIEATSQLSEENPFARSSRSKSRDAMKKMQTTPSSKKVKNEENSEEEEKKEEDRKEKDPPMTELQILIIEAIDMSNGSASFEQIFDHVNKKFDNLRRRDGTPYTSECRRAIQASLSNNPTTRPFFKKEIRKGNAVWSLAKRSVEFLADYKRNKKQESESEEESKKEKGSSDEDEDEEDDDDEDAKEDESSDESDKDEEEEKKKVEAKDDRHLYANRQKRARRIKEKAEIHKRQLRETTETSRSEKDLRSRKRRK